ncbi:MAG TPA: osmotically inducible protein C [Cytophagales bacterium]|nr:osmotically inducible protein C [Cytophagales bacterium]HAA20328.1 osmotically inducible protein C [Cytophagales bacterium]HAP62901.1 osmotically inducible protein C [Cytophagales bacterium]
MPISAKIGRDEYRTELSNGRHDLIGDEPDPFGADLGPTPYDFLLMALGSCVCMTLRMYADRKGWPMEKVEIVLDQDRIYAKDCENCESEDGYVHVIEKQITFHGNLDDAQRKRLMEIADKCPVQKTLTHEIVIKSVEKR